MGKKVVVLGNSIAGAVALEEIRKIDKEAELTIIGFDGYYPYNQQSLPGLVAKTVTASEIFYKTKDFYDKNNIKVILDQKISRINLKRNKIYTEEKTQIDFDVLIISEVASHQFPDIKGTNKSGIYDLNRLKDIDQVIKAEIFTDTFVIVSDFFNGCAVADELLKKGKEVYLVTANPYLLSDLIEEDVSAWLIKNLGETRLKVVCDNEVVEVLGDSDAKALRLKTGKVIAAPLIIFEQTKADFRFLGESELKVTDTVAVDQNFQSNLEHVFAVGRAASLDGVLKIGGQSKDELIAQGKIVANKILARETALDEIVAVQDCEIFNYPMQIIGNMTTQEVEAQRSFLLETNTYKKLLIKDNVVLGAVLINSTIDQEQIVTMIKDRSALVSTETTQTV